jgi:fumarate reductase flavoprotein subunit
MGGIRTRPNGESTKLKGLFACGEASCWDMHGFNRLGGNSVAETVVAGMIVGEYIADYCDSTESDIDISTLQVAEFIKHEQQNIDSLVTSKGSESATDIMREMQILMTEKVGIFRSHEQLNEAVEQLQVLYSRSSNIGLSYRSAAVNPELVTAYRVRRMLKLALCVAYGALQRTESRGAHHREDYPERNDRDWLRRTLASWPTSDQVLPTLDYEDLDVMAMELPPGWRGYGTKDFIEHPDAASRLAEIERIKQNMPDADRYEIQSALMTYEELLPARYRGRNQRLRDDCE